MSKPIEDKANQLFTKVVRGITIFIIIILLFFICVDLATIVDMGTIVLSLLIIFFLITIKGWKYEQHC